MLKRVLAIVVVLGLLAAGGVYWFGQKDKPAQTNTSNNAGSSSTNPVVADTDSLNYSDKGLTSIPKAVLNDKSAKQLDLSKNQLTSLPSEIGQLSSLYVLDVSYNSLTGALPGEIRKMTRLQTLIASHNQLTGIPAEVGQLSDIKKIDLSYNKIDTMPNEIGNLRSLQELNLAYNTYKTIPDSVLKLTGLKTLDVSGNPLAAGEIDRAKAALKNTLIVSN